MSNRSWHPEQLSLPFESDEVRTQLAQVISLNAHRQRLHSTKQVDEQQEKNIEKEILDRILDRADQLPWYK